MVSSILVREGSVRVPVSMVHSLEHHELGSLCFFNGVPLHVSTTFVPPWFLSHLSPSLPCSAFIPWRNEFQEKLRSYQELISNPQLLCMDFPQILLQ